MTSLLPAAKAADTGLLAEYENVKEFNAGIRTVRKQHNIAFKETVELKVKENDRYPRRFESVIRKMGNTNAVEIVKEGTQGAWSFICGTVEYFIPATGQVNVEETRAKLEADLQYTRGFLESVMKKLNNEKFMKGAPEKVIENERKKQADAESKIKAIEEQLRSL